MNKTNNETKLTSNLKILGGVFVTLAILLFIFRLIIDYFYGGSPLEKTNDILIAIAFGMGSLAYTLEKRVILTIFYGLFFILYVLSLLGI
ncbi:MULTISPECIES: hypothetical protein [Staphylococcus]|uniref:hypothetical protein n=2 Tax=Staphylococcus TaxID=1279 RepID=UPI00188910F3|nr:MULTISPECIES: hypothetical protein [Staphylococcus]MBF2751597.1 hypothetical protein [Staphylococcus saprophyticus]MCG2351225.1 hypothetical protein [Staphylococcus epidermidis]QPW18638.1 hypothetical protein I7831_13410 [Staphylococcus saprophyticus]